MRGGKLRNHRHEHAVVPGWPLRKLASMAQERREIVHLRVALAGPRQPAVKMVLAQPGVQEMARYTPRDALCVEPVVFLLERERPALEIVVSDVGGQLLELAMLKAACGDVGLEAAPQLGSLPWAAYPRVT